MRFLPLRTLCYDSTLCLAACQPFCLFLSCISGGLKHPMPLPALSSPPTIHHDTPTTTDAARLRYRSCSLFFFSFYCFAYVCIMIMGYVD